MDQFTYMRPREKIHERGVGSLSSMELLQVIIGSGTKHHSAARISRHVLQWVEQHNESPSYEDLRSIPGLGHAKVCLIIAAIEFGRRRALLPDVTEVPRQELFSKVSSSSKRLIEFITQDGEGKAIETRIESINRPEKIREVVRKVFSFAMHDRANAVFFGLGMKKQDLIQPEEYVLDMIKKLYETADLLEIRVSAIWLVNDGSKRAMPRRVLQ